MVDSRTEFRQFQFLVWCDALHSEYPGHYLPEQYILELKAENAAPNVET